MSFSAWFPFARNCRVQVMFDDVKSEHLLCFADVLDANQSFLIAEICQYSTVLHRRP
jgi:hypothetical protein